MKIYQIHAYGGEWEDRFDYIVGSYLSKEKANAEKERLEAEQEKIRKCESCPLYYCELECDSDCEKCYDGRLVKTVEYCDRYSPVDGNDDKCVNYYIDLYDKNYRIEEVEVEE